MRKALYLLPLAGALLFGWASAHLLHEAWEARSSRDWPTAVGTVQTSKWRRFVGKGCHFALTLRYAYVVDGTPQVGDNYRFGGECDDEVIQIAQAHPVGSQVVVHYDPERPWRSVLLAGSVSGNTRLGLVLAPFMLLLSLVVAWRLRPRA